ncbi:MAG: hypothetical protein Q9178_001261 [Gyalolechia marmorata]
MSPSRSIFSDVATGEEAAFPNATYLRTRYKKLQRCIVSRVPGSSRTSGTRHAGTGEVSNSRSTSSLGSSDPSSDAIRALNGQSRAGTEPDIIHAMIKDLDGNVIHTSESTASTSAKGADDSHERLEPSSHNPQSFSARFDRLLQAVGYRRHIRFESAKDGGDVNVSATNLDGSETGSSRSVTHQIAANPANFGRIISPDGSPRTPESYTSADRFFCPGTHISRRNPVHASSPWATSSALSGTGFKRLRARSPIITETQRHQLEQRILDKIAACSGGYLESTVETAAHLGDGIEASGASHGTHVGFEVREQTVDPTQVSTINRDGERECHRISPIRLDYQKGPGLATPSLGSSGSSSELEFPLNHKSNELPLSLKHGADLDHDLLLTCRVATTDTWVTVDSDQGPSSEQEGEDTQLEREQKRERIFSWLHRIKDAFMESKESPTKKLGNAVNVFREGPARTIGESATNSSPRSAKALKDVTNVRHAGYLRNSFAQDKIRQEKLSATSENQKKQSERPGYEEDLDPEVAYSLARLEGRVPPRPTSPFLVERCREDSQYGSDVEVELPPLDLASPQPMRPDHECVVGNWSATMEEAVEAGFECVLEPPG